MARYIDVDEAIENIRNGDGTSMQKLFAECCLLDIPTADVAPKSEVAREIFEKIKRSKVMLGHPAKIICYRATRTGEVEEIVEGWVVSQSRIEELEKKYIGGKTDEDISD